MKSLLACEIMEITYLGHSSFKIKTKNTTVVCDPFDPKMVGIKFPSIEADIVTISHDHQDHSYLEGIKDYKKALSGPGEYEIMGVTILGFPSFHDNKKGEERGKNTIYVFESEGLRVAHLGDLGHKLSDKMVEELGGVNILIIPVGGEVSLSLEDACGVVRSIEPNITIPMHFRDDGINQETFGKLHPVEDFLKEIGLPTERLPKLSVKLSDLTDEQKVVLLERK